MSGTWRSATAGLPRSCSHSNLQHYYTHQGQPRNDDLPFVWSVRVQVIVWAHNSHLGDARFTKTDCEPRGERQLNLGQLARERLGEDNVLIVGFSTHTGMLQLAKRFLHQGRYFCCWSDWSWRDFFASRHSEGCPTLGRAWSRHGRAAFPPVFVR